MREVLLYSPVGILNGAKMPTGVRAAMRSHLSLLLLLKMLVRESKPSCWYIPADVCIEKLLVSLVQVINVCSIDRDGLLSL